MKLATSITREVRWTSATVKDVLSKYALGLFCQNFDKRLEYHIERVGERKWLCMHNECFTSEKEKNFIPNFIRS